MQIVNSDMRINTNFQNISFHDTCINDISRSGAKITMGVAGVFISRDHPQSRNKDWFAESCTLVLFGVTEEKAKYWDDDKAPKPHPEPDMPIDEIMHAKYVNGIFHFDGFKNNMPWYEWFISANGFELNVISATEKKS